MIRLFLVAVCSLQGILACEAQALAVTDNPVKKIAPLIDSLYTGLARRYQSPGMVYGVVMNGTLVHSGALGHANLEKKIPATETTAFRIASMTKSFISVAILQLRDKGKLALDDRADKYITELKQVRYPMPDAAPITIRQLLTHSAGFPEDNPWGDRQLDISEETMLAMFRQGISMSTDPGTGYEYSNMGFAMLGYIIHRVTGMPYQQYINENVFKPLGMHHTYWEFSKVPEQELAIGYRFVEGKWVKQPMLHDGAYGAMGGLITTLADFAKYLSFHLNATNPRGAASEPLRRSSVLEIQRPWQFAGLNARATRADGFACATVSAYGYGLRWLEDCTGRVQVGHSGGLPGFGSNWTMMPAYGIGVICFSNVTYAPASQINAQVLDAVIKNAPLTPRFVKASPILEQRKNELVRLLPAWDVGDRGKTQQIFAVNFFDDYFIDSLKKSSLTAFEAAGRIVRVQPMVPENNLRGYFILEGERADIRVWFSLSPENPAKIQAFRIAVIRRDQ